MILYFPRCGADPTIKDKDGLSPEEILTEKRPPGWEETWHWFQKFRPGMPIGKNLILELNFRTNKGILRCIKARLFDQCNLVSRKVQIFWPNWQSASLNG